MRNPLRFIAVPLVMAFASTLFVSVGANADYPDPVDTTNAQDSASLEILMGSVVGANSRNTISEVNTANWVWVDATSDRTSFLTSSTTPTGSSASQNSSYNSLSDQYYHFQNPNYVRNPANTINGVQVNQGNPTGAGAVAIDWSTGSKLPGSGGFLTKISVYDSDHLIKTNARFRLQVMGKDETDNVYKVLGNGASGTQFSPGSARVSMTFFGCDPSASSSCQPLAAGDTPGGVNPTYNITTAGAGEAYGQTNSSGFAYVWVTMTGVAASNLFQFQLRLSDAEAGDVTDFPADLDYSDVFPSRIISGSGFTPTSTNGSATMQEMPWNPAAAGKDYTTQASFRITTSCLWGSTLADTSASTSVISPDTRTAGDGNSTLTVTMKNRCGGVLSGQKVTIVKPDGTQVVLTTNGSGVATLAVEDTDEEWSGDFDTYLGDFPEGTPTTGEPFASPTMTFQAAPAANAGESDVTIDDDTDTADGTSTSIVTVTVKDQYGDPVGAGQSVCFSVTNGDGTISSGPWVTDANGQVTTTVTTPTTSGQTQINAALGTCDSPQGSIGNVTYNHDPGSADAPSSNVTIESDTADSDGTTETTVTVVVRDANGNPVGAGQSVCLVLADGTGSLSAGPWATDSQGRVTATVTSPSSPGFAQIDATLGTCDAPGESIGTVNIDFTEPQNEPLANTGISLPLPLVPLLLLAFGIMMAVTNRARREVS